MTPSSHLMCALACTFALSACGEAPLKAPLPGRDLEGAASSTLAFPSGEWSDDLGNIWRASVANGEVIAQGVCGPGLGFALRGRIDGRRLNYTIEAPENVVVASGTAELVNAGHAFFDTRLSDGQPNADGVLHFTHPSPARASSGLETVCLAGTPTMDAPLQSDPQQDPTPEQEAQP